MGENIHLITPAEETFLRCHLSGFDPARWGVGVAGEAGSDRRFLRITPPDGAGESVVLVVWDSRDPDWWRFLGIVEELGRYTTVLPRIMACDPKHGLILEEDLGSTTLRAACAAADRQRVEEIYRMVTTEVAGWHRLDPHLSPTVCARRMDKETFLWESSYFAVHCVTEYCGCGGLLNRAWEDERMALAEAAAALPMVIMHRDFQSENVMVTERGIRFVDFQGARLGPAHYDLASLLYDPYASYLEGDLVCRLIKCYAEAGGRDDPVGLRLCAEQRLMQALGAYGNLGLHKNKQRYLSFIPLALERLLEVLESSGDFPALLEVTAACLAACSGAVRPTGGSV